MLIWESSFRIDVVSMSKIKLSKLAEKVIYQTIKEANIPPDKGLRLEKFENGLKLTIDYPLKDDQTIKILLP